MKLKDIMSRPVQTVNEDTKVDMVARVMLDNSIGCVPVLGADGEMTGIITHEAFVSKEKTLPFSRYSYQTLLGHPLKTGMETIYETAKEMSARDIMIRNPTTLTEDDTVKTFLETLFEKGTTHVPIVRDGSLVGIVARQDLLKMVVSPLVPHDGSDS